ncbi:thioredoxin domain-containing protein [Candidatus Deianiraea vastatrix]|uniref:Thioredoxin-like fold domain-containing protein n=1 Tax=Candidatus Deianiraea vastatrix TaxID=2163644 RepID=A0A5B8XGT1_9RICK|nr:thioredoxin domain-containing protein [Candidatus Deianiraea vastatrix]QED23371.1 Putative protein-disulfide oxidoreductase [Candidatus Deianiraea vastatrix]
MGIIRKSKKIIIISVFFLLGLIFASIFAKAISKKKADIAKQEYVQITDQGFLDAVKLNPDKDIFIGEKDAKLTIIKYGSFTCHHCSSFFQNAFPNIYKYYIQSGKAVFIHRSVVGDVLAFQATKVLYCTPGTPEEKMKAAMLIYTSQMSWINSDKHKSMEKLIKVLSSVNIINKKYIKQCVEDPKLEERIIEEQNFIIKNLSIRSTPTIIIDDIKIRGYAGYSAISDIIESKLKKE